MAKIAHKYDPETFAWIPGEEIHVEDSEDYQELPENYTFTPIPQPNWKPVFNPRTNEWVESITEEELTEFYAPKEPEPEPKSEVEVLQEKLSQMEDMMLWMMGEKARTE